MPRYIVATRSDRNWQAVDAGKTHGGHHIRNAPALDDHGDVLIEPHAAIHAMEHAHAVVVCDMYTPINLAPVGNNPALTEWLKTQHAGGALIGSVCTGALVLAEAGLLDGRQAAAHWAYAELFRRNYPGVTIRKESILCLTEEKDRIVTAGGVTSWQELAIYLVARFCGLKQAFEIAKVHLLAGHHDGQLPFAAMNRSIDDADAAIAKSQRWISVNYAAANPVARMAEVSGLNPRTFARRFKAAAGHSAIDYVQLLRVEEAKQLLENAHLPADEVGNAVGYEDSASFRRLFRRKAGLSPAAYRRKFERIAAPAR